MKRTIDPNKSISDSFDHFVKHKYGCGEFPVFEATELFFQWYFQTNLRLNDFKNMIGYVKRTEDYVFVEEKNRRKFYKAAL